MVYLLKRNQNENNMKSLYIIILILIFGCSGEYSDKSPVNNAGIAKDSIENTSIGLKSIPKADSIKSRVDSTISNDKIDFDFLSVCDSLEIWQGGIQGVPKSDSTGLYIMAQCFANKSFDLIVYSNREIELKEGVDYKNRRIRNGIEGAVYYAFVIPKKVPENPENEFDTYEYVFPSKVKVYRYFPGGWILIKEKEVNSFEELGRLKINSIYNK
jgi:hypothetical protein